MKKNVFLWLMLFGMITMGPGCATTCETRTFHSVPLEEAVWIRNGEPIEFEKILWYPTDIVENLLDDEVYLVEEYRGVQFFLDKTDVRPYERIYTKFGKHKFRVFEQKTVDDKG